MEINDEKLFKELKSAGIDIIGCNSKGVVWDNNNQEIQNRQDVKSIISAHDPIPFLEDLRKEEYQKVGVNVESMIFALWKKVMSSDSTDADALQSLMDGIDALVN